MTQTKLTEPLQVGLWYQAKAGFITQLDFVETRPEGDFFLGNNGVFYNEYGETTYSVEHDLIRCLGADPFKSDELELLNKAYAELFGLAQCQDDIIFLLRYGTVGSRTLELMERCKKEISDIKAKKQARGLVDDKTV